MLHLADDVRFHRLLSFSKLAHDLLVGSFHHLPEHLDILLPFFSHLFGVDFELILQQFRFLLAFLLSNILFTLDMAQCLILLLQLELYFLLLPLHLLGDGHNPANQLFLASMRKFVNPSIHLAPNVGYPLV